MTSLIAIVLLTSGMLILPLAVADDTGPAENEPLFDLSHRYNVTVDENTICNEEWQLNIAQGEVTLLFLANNLTSTDGGAGVGYQFDINYNIDGEIYISQISINHVTFVIGEQRIQSVMRTCDDIDMTISSVEFVDGSPLFYCNISFSSINVYPDDAFPEEDINPSIWADSTFDLTLSHRIVIGQNRTDIKVESIFDLNRTALIDLFTHTEIEAGTSFAIELPYTMVLTLPDSGGVPLPPSGYSDDGMEYGIEMDSGETLTVSKLTMNNTFSVWNQSGCYSSLGYSSINNGPISEAVHGFSGLIYKDTWSIKSDPEITCYYDDDDGGSSSSTVLYTAVAGAVAVAIIAGVLYMKKRKG